MKIWILTSEYNDYNQYGVYFIKAYKDKPTIGMLQEDIGRTADYCEHVLSGGGRIDYENAWFYLQEEEI